jgi:hypothetical protein
MADYASARLPRSTSKLNAMGIYEFGYPDRGRLSLGNGFALETSSISA